MLFLCPLVSFVRRLDQLASNFLSIIKMKDKVFSAKDADMVDLRKKKSVIECIKT